jgi:hypothetical protein
VYDIIIRITRTAIAPHVQPNPTPSPGCAFSGPEVAEEAVLHVGCLSALADRYNDAGARVRIAKLTGTVNAQGEE